MKTALTSKNRIKEIREQRDMSSRALAKILDISAAQMSRLESGKSPLSIKWILKIADALEVNSNEIIDLPFNKNTSASCDDALLGSAIGWLLEASDKFKVKLSRQDLSKWASYVYKEAVEQPLNFKQTQYLAITIVRVIKEMKG